ncbi:MAG: transcriptional repressor LexA [Actinomycetota bacterium]|jgi:repressor LexA
MAEDLIDYEQLFDTSEVYMAEVLTPTRREILDFIVACQRERNYPPTVREIGNHVNLAPATVHTHIQVLVAAGYIEKNPQQPRTLTVHYDAAPATGEITSIGSSREIPFVGDVAAGVGTLAEESAYELISLPEQFAGRGESFMLQVRGDSMINAGILPGDFVVVQRQETALQGEIIVAGIHDGEATVKRYFPQGRRVILKPENDSMEPMEFDADEVSIIGKVISVLRSY